MPMPITRHGTSNATVHRYLIQTRRNLGPQEVVVLVWGTGGVYVRWDGQDPQISGRDSVFVPAGVAREFNITPIRGVSYDVRLIGVEGSQYSIELRPVSANNV